MSWFSNKNKEIKIYYFPILLISLLYLLLPNLLFLLGWFRLSISLPLCTLLLFSTIMVARRASLTEKREKRYIICTLADITKLFFALILVLIFVDLVGFTGHVNQASDFTARNAIYHTLIQNPWPIYSNKGEYFIYYHAFWLPPALFCKYFGNIFSADIVLCTWSYTGIVLFCLMLFYRLRGNILPLFIILLCLGSISDLPRIPYRLWATSPQHLIVPSSYIIFLKYLGFESAIHYFSTWSNVAYCFNSTIPALLCMGVLLSKALPLRYFPIPAAMLAAPSVFCVIALAPLILILIFRDYTLLKRMLHCPHIWTFSILLLCNMIYYLGQEGSETRFIWSDSVHLQNTATAFHLKWVRILRYLYVVSGGIIPAFILIDKHFRKTIWFNFLITSMLFLPLLWIGKGLNEFLLKGSVCLFSVYSVLLLLQWKHSKQKQKIIITIFLALSSFHILGDASYRKWTNYSWNPEIVKKHIAQKWGDSLNHPESPAYDQFWGKIVCPVIQYSHPNDYFIGAAPREDK